MGGLGNGWDAVLLPVIRRLLWAAYWKLRSRRPRRTRCWRLRVPPLCLASGQVVGGTSVNVVGDERGGAWMEEYYSEL